METPALLLLLPVGLPMPRTNGCLRTTFEDAVKGKQFAHIVQALTWVNNHSLPEGECTFPKAAPT